MQYYHEDIRYQSDIDIIFRIEQGYGNYVSKHWHNSLELIYVLEGVQEFSIGNEAMHPIYPGNFILINSREIHSFQNKSHLKTMILQIPRAFLKKYIPDIDSIRFTSFFPPMDKNQEQDYQEILEICKDMTAIYPIESSEALLCFQSLVFRLLFLMLRSFKQEVPYAELENTQKYIARLGRITSFVQEHYAEPLTLNQAAKEVSLNPDYFTRFFKKYMGVTFFDYVNSVRMERIQSDLLKTDLSIQELLELHGFSNYKRFLKLYRSRYGCTPGQMRKHSPKARQK